MSHLDDLRKAVESLEEGYELVKGRLEKDMPDVNPLLVVATDGRYILLDSLTEIVRAKTVLTQMGDG